MDGGDRFSDLDLTFSIADHVPVGDVLNDWTRTLIDELDAVHRGPRAGFGLPAGGFMLAPKQRDEAQLEEGMGAGSGRFERLSALAGVLAVVLWAAGAAITGGDHIGLPGGLPEEGADETLAYFQENESTVVAASALFMVGSLSFLWFVGILRTRLAGAEGGVATFAAIAFAGGVATAIFALGMPTGGLVASLNADEIGASTAEALNAVETAFLIAAELSAIVMLVAAAVVSLQRGALPRWWAVVSIVLAVWLLILPIGWAGLLLGLPAWTVVTSVLLLRGSAVTPRI